MRPKGDPSYDDTPNKQGKREFSGFGDANPRAKKRRQTESSSYDEDQLPSRKPRPNSQLSDDSLEVMIKKVLKPKSRQTSWSDDDSNNGGEEAEDADGSHGKDEDEEEDTDLEGVVRQRRIQPGDLSDENHEPSDDGEDSAHAEYWSDSCTSNSEDDPGWNSEDGKILGNTYDGEVAFDPGITQALSPNALPYPARRESPKELKCQ